MGSATSDIRATGPPSRDGHSLVLPDLLAQIPEREVVAIIPIRKNGWWWTQDCPAGIARNETRRGTLYQGRAFWKRWTGYHAAAGSKRRCAALDPRASALPPGGSTENTALAPRGGPDVFRGGSGTDTGGANDSLFGNGGGDSLGGMGGKDLLRSGSGTDRLTGGSGVDTFVLSKSSGDDRVFDFSDGTELIGLDGLTVVLWSFVGKGSWTLIESRGDGTDPGDLSGSDFVRREPAGGLRPAPVLSAAGFRPSSGRIAQLPTTPA